MKVYLFSLLTLFAFGETFAQNLLKCDSLETNTPKIYLSSLQDSVLFSFQNTASNAQSLSQNLYVIQWVSLTDRSVIDTVIPTAKSHLLTSYIHPNQTVRLDFTYVAGIAPLNYSVQGYYHVYAGTNGTSDTCKIPVEFVFGSMSIDESLPSQKFRFYPNPADDVIDVDAQMNGTIKLLNASGREVLSREVLVSKSTKIYLEKIPQGLYILQFLDREGKIVERQKMLKI